MKVSVHMLAFCNGEIREVNVPDDELASLGNIFYWGQNDCQPQNLPSVSMGDVIELNGEYHRIEATCFQLLSKKEFDAYKEQRIADNAKKMIA